MKVVCTLVMAALLAVLALPGLAHASGAAQASLVTGQEAEQDGYVEASILVHNTDPIVGGRTIDFVRITPPFNFGVSSQDELVPPGWVVFNTGGSLEYRTDWQFGLGLGGPGLPPQSAVLFEFQVFAGSAGGDWTVSVSSDNGNSTAPATVAPGGTLTTSTFRTTPTAQGTLLEGQNVNPGDSVPFSFRIQSTEAPGGEPIEFVGFRLPPDAKLLNDDSEIVAPAGWTVNKFTLGGTTSFINFRAPARQQSPACVDVRKSLCNYLPAVAAIQPGGELVFKFTADVFPSCCGDTLSGDWDIRVQGSGMSANSHVTVAPGGSLTTTNHPS